MRLLIFILTIMLVSPAFGQRRKKADEEPFSNFVEGITYALPRTGIRLQVKAIKEVFEPGPYSSYAQQLLGIDNVKNRESVKWSIKDIKLKTFSEPDPDQVYKAFGEGAYNISLTPEGCLAGINSDIENLKQGHVETNLFIEQPDIDNGFSFANFNDTPMYTAGDSTNNYRPVRVSAEKKAAGAAARILDCRLTRFHIAAGLMDEFHPDGTAYKVSLDELDRIEKNYLSLFVGRTTYTNEIFNFDFVPASLAEKGEVIFRFSEEKGVLHASDLSGKPVMIKVEPEKKLIDKYSGLIGSENPAAGESGVYYRMPAIATINIIFELKTIATTRILLPQFGSTAPLPEDMLYGDHIIEIHPETGAIKKVIKK